MAEDELRAGYRARQSALTDLATELESETKRHLAQLDHIDRVAFRAKEVESFVAKALQHDPPYAEPLIEIEDQVAGRVTVCFLSDVTIVKERIAGLFQVVEERFERPAHWATFDYESFQAIYGIPHAQLPASWADIKLPPTTFELQIRTLFQHAFAEPQHDILYKPSGEPGLDDRRRLAWVAASAWGADQALETVRESLFRER